MPKRAAFRERRKSRPIVSSPTRSRRAGSAHRSRWRVCRRVIRASRHEHFYRAEVTVARKSDGADELRRASQHGHRRFDRYHDQSDRRASLIRLTHYCRADDGVDGHHRPSAPAEISVRRSRYEAAHQRPPLSAPPYLVSFPAEQRAAVAAPARLCACSYRKRSTQRGAEPICRASQRESSKAKWRQRYSSASWKKTLKSVHGRPIRQTGPASARKCRITSTWLHHQWNRFSSLPRIFNRRAAVVIQRARERSAARPARQCSETAVISHNTEKFVER